MKPHDQSQVAVQHLPSQKVGTKEKLSKLDAKMVHGESEIFSVVLNDIRSHLRSYLKHTVTRIRNKNNHVYVLRPQYPIRRASRHTEKDVIN